MRDDLYMLEATSPGASFSVRTGPLPIVEAMRLVDEYLDRNDWTYRYWTLTPVDDAIRTFTALHRPRPTEEADYFVALRRAIICDRQRDGLDDHVVRAVLAHVDVHRPMQMWTGDEECLLGECGGEGGHARDDAGVCEGMQRAEQICVACSAIVDSCSEYGPHYAVQVRWPCSVIVTAGEQYQVPTVGGAVR